MKLFWEAKQCDGRINLNFVDVHHKSIDDVSFSENLFFVPTTDGSKILQMITQQLSLRHYVITEGGYGNLEWFQEVHIDYNLFIHYLISVRSENTLGWCTTLRHY